jgi:hypothetical protein
VPAVYFGQEWNLPEVHELRGNERVQLEDASIKMYAGEPCSVMAADIKR